MFDLPKATLRLWPELDEGRPAMTVSLAEEIRRAPVLN